MRLETVKPAEKKEFRSLVDNYWLEIMPNADTVRTPESRDAYFARRFLLDAESPRIFWGIEGENHVGFIALTLENKKAKINDFYIEPDYRRQGHGSHMVEAIRDLTDDLGIEQIDLNVRRDNPSSLVFWQAQGFMIGHYELTQYRDPIKRIGFRGALSSDFADQ